MLHKTFIAAMLAAALLSSADAQGRRDSRGPAVPPPVVSQTITAQRGEKVTVPLAIHGTRGEMLEFLIRTPPSHGKLSAVKNAAMNTATVIYTPSAKGSAAEDRFTYAVRGSEGVSAPGVIAIRFSEPVVMPPRLAAQNEIEFPPVFPGQRSTAELEIANEGGGVLEGEVAVEEPWSIEGPKIFKIAAHRNAIIRLIFSPAQPGVRTGEAIITGSQRKIVSLRASAEQRLDIAPAQLKLTAQPGNQTRMGVLKITNRSEEDASIAVEAGERLLTDRIVRVPARSTSSVPIFADAAVGAAFDEVVKLSSKEWSASVNVHAVAVGAILRFTAAEVNISASAGDAAAGGTAILENSGGEPVTVRLDVERPFEVATRVVTAPARGRVEIPIIAREAKAGTFRSALKAVGDGGSATMQVKAEIAEPAQIQTKAHSTPPAAENKLDSTPASAVPFIEQQAEQIAAELAELRKARAESTPAESGPKESDSPIFPTDERDIPNMLGKFARGTGAETALLDWPANLGPVENLRIEERVLSISDGGDLQIGWSPLPPAKIAQAGDRMTAELRGLRPGTLYTVRVLAGKDTDATVLFTADFRTAAKKPFFTAGSRTPLLVATLFVLVFAIWRTRRAAK